MEMALAVAGLVLAVLAVGTLVWLGLALRDFAARGTGSRREGLIFQQRLALAAVAGLPAVLISMRLLDKGSTQLWWLFLLAGPAVIVLVRTTVELRRSDDE
jgi:hypothetical protein